VRASSSAQPTEEKKEREEEKDTLQRTRHNNYVDIIDSAYSGIILNIQLQL